MCRTEHTIWPVLLVMVTLLLPEKTYVSGTKLYNTPACHIGIMKLFKWCEQAECSSNCTCLSTEHVCKQICNRPNCDKLFCSSPKTCYQNVLVEYRRPIPKVHKMVAHTPITQQDCSQANCTLMKALRYYEKHSTSFQGCSEGLCGHIYSTADTAKQFCGNCKAMTCTGPHSKNCSQICVLGKCKKMVCNSKNCTQLCTHDSTCQMECGENTEHCEQSCSYGSTCNMICRGKNCKQTCKDEKSCTKKVIFRLEENITGRFTGMPYNLSESPGNSNNSDRNASLFSLKFYVILLSIIHFLISLT